MNQTLAKLYGLSNMSKTASDEANVDLTQISAADFLAAIEAEEAEGQGEGEVDLSQMSAQELIDLANQNEDPIEKMASSGEFEYWDAAGRIMAHAYNDELQKVAGGDEIEIDLENMSGEQLMELIEAGYEFVEDEGEKVATDISALRRAGSSLSDIRAAVRGGMHNLSEMDPARHGKVVGKTMNKERKAFQKAQPNIAKMRKSESAGRKAKPGFLAQKKQEYLGSGKSVKDALRARPGATAGAIGAAGVAAGGAAGATGGYFGGKKKG